MYEGTNPLAPEIKITFPKSCSQGRVEETIFLRSSSTIGCLVVGKSLLLPAMLYGPNEMGRGLPIHAPNAEELVLVERDFETLPFLPTDKFSSSAGYPEAGGYHERLPTKPVWMPTQPAECVNETVLP